VTAKVNFQIAGQPVQADITVPAGPVRARELLPVFQGLTDLVVEVAEKAALAGGEKVSCKKGCGACCRQLVPISEMEAYHLRDVVNSLPEPRRSEVRARFADACRRLHELGLAEKLLDHERLPVENIQELGLRYFYLQIACPFLEEESCSIHAQRPLACREYLVTTPAENCARPTAETVRLVPLGSKVSKAVGRLGQDRPTPVMPHVPLVLALEWADAHAEEPPRRTGPELLREVFERMAGGKVP
jgi:Fe-S-cluster containining protein